MNKYPKIPPSLKVITIDEVMAWKASELHTTLQPNTIGINRHGVKIMLGVSHSKMYAAVNYFQDKFPKVIGKKGENEFIYDLADVVAFLKAHDVQKMIFSLNDYAKDQQPQTFDQKAIQKFKIKNLPEKQPDQIVISSPQITNMKRAKKPRKFAAGTLIDRAGIGHLTGVGRTKVSALLKSTKYNFPSIVCYSPYNTQSYYDLNAVIAWTQQTDLKAIVFSAQEYQTAPLNVRKQPTINNRPTAEKIPNLKPPGQLDIKSSGKAKTVTVHLNERYIVPPLRPVDPWHGHNNSHSIDFF